MDTNKPVEIVFYSTNGDSEASFNERWGDALRKKFPNWTFTYIQNQKGFSLNELITAGTKFDIYFESVAVFQSGKANDLWYDMTELIKKHNIDLSRFEPATLEAMKMMAGDQMTGLPVNMMTMGLFYNKDIFDKFGVPYPKDGMTWDQVAELSKKLTRNDGDKSYLGFVESELHVVRLNPLSIPLVDPQTNQSTLEDERWRKMLQTLVLDTKQNAEVKDWILNANNGKMPGPGNFVGNQQAAMMGYLSNFMQTNSKDLEAMNWDIVSYPSFKETPGVGTQAYPTFLGITKFSEHKEEAMEAIKYLVSDEFQMESSRKGNMTSLKNEEIRKAIGQDGKFKDKNLKSLYYNKFAPAYPRTPFDSSIEGKPTEKIVDVLTGKMDLNTMLRTAKEESDKIITERLNALNGQKK
ncbi:extracellular solute-binding protein [Paenibacillus sp. P25]|nr:extracellular solute-binding protein [Paenibacillus sp. P25]